MGGGALELGRPGGGGGGNTKARATANARKFGGRTRQVKGGEKPGKGSTARGEKKIGSITQRGEGARATVSKEFSKSQSLEASKVGKEKIGGGYRAGREGGARIAEKEGRKDHKKRPSSSSLHLRRERGTD